MFGVKVPHPNDFINLSDSLLSSPCHRDGRRPLASFIYKVPKPVRFVSLYQAKIHLERFLQDICFPVERPLFLTFFHKYVAWPITEADAMMADE